MKILSVQSLIELLEVHGYDRFMSDLVSSLKRDFADWHSFTQMPRPAMHVQDGVIELMPISDNKKYYSFKYVNCHPRNTSLGLQTVVATGQLSKIDTGYPLMFSEMTLLTAIRTAAMSAIATDLMSRKNSRVLAIIGTGAQSEFQADAAKSVRDIRQVRYFDTDSGAMDKFEKNMIGKSFKLTRCKNSEEAVRGADIITVCTACKAHVDVLKNEWIEKGVHINALGGDTIGKTELEFGILKRAKIVVEYFEQAYIEGEIQRFSKVDAEKHVYAELHELINGSKQGRDNDQQITVFDSVGIALEDYSVLRLTYELAEKYNIGEELNMLPVLKDPKDLMPILGHAILNI